ncbi:hypothetical protein ZD86_02160 [Salmonella enterica subsp. enterica]|nr:hypothetical protein [Salmonella enterica subsp. enterica serovar Poona]EBW2889637.1 hypothetical protein [Salmonella enterica subsp. enterica serovar Poona]ECD3711256.1 hypothetical protein [Salmonella enterica subsp. enterica serovar Poona]ECG6029156.1 hypothetical protein [Salmonella enterica subsp. enterica serovar Poona]ECH9318881.1 hypothetical protein [Salmonella enterica subsp. enterica serovar Poona]
MTDLWLTPQECVGKYGLPTTPTNVRNQLNKLSEDKPELKRKREGTKAYEYNITVLLNQDASLTTPVSTTTKHSVSKYDEVICTILNLLNDDEKIAAVEIFKLGGISELMPGVVTASRGLQNTVESVLGGGSSGRSNAAETEEEQAQVTRRGKVAG